MCKAMQMCALRYARHGAPLEGRAKGSASEPVVQHGIEAKLYEYDGVVNERQELTTKPAVPRASPETSAEHKPCKPLVLRSNTTLGAFLWLRRLHCGTSLKYNNACCIPVSLHTWRMTAPCAWVLHHADDVAHTLMSSQFLADRQEVDPGGWLQARYTIGARKGYRL